MRRIPSHTPDKGLRDGRSNVTGCPGPRTDGAGRLPAVRREAGAGPLRFLALGLVLASASCGGKRFETMTDPVTTFLDSVKKGQRGPARLKYCFSKKLEERDVEARVRMVADAMERHGTEYSLEVLGALGHKADIKVSFPGGGVDAPAFRFQVEYEESGWRIRMVALLAESHT